jgi:hypothetical protein
VARLDCRLARLQEIPISLQFLSVDLRPGFYEPTLRRGKAAAQALNGVQGKDGGVVLVIRVKMPATMGLALLSEHPNDDPEEPRQIGHAARYIGGQDFIRSGSVGPTALPLSRERRSPKLRIARACLRRSSQRLVRRHARLYIGCMNVAFELPPAQAEKLRLAADQLGISPSELARAAVTDLLAERDDAFQQAAERVLRKNTELYRRLA